MTNDRPRTKTEPSARVTAYREGTNNVRVRDLAEKRDEPFVLRDAHGAPYLVPRALRIVRGNDAPVYLPLELSQPMSFGRSSEDNTVVLPMDSISRLHGRLSYRADGRWVYRDLGSRNGTHISEFINRDPMEDPRELEPGRDHPISAGQSLVFGNHAFRVSLLAELPPEARSKGAREVSLATKALHKALLQHGAHDLPVLLFGASGTGKTFAARRIHELSQAKGQFVLINCARLPNDANSLHSQLLGHVKGAFTGTVENRLGQVMAADNGTLFLDEVESAPKEAQQFLLDILENSGTFSPLGAKPDVVYPRPRFRLIAASKVPLEESGLRQDLCHRLARGGIIHLPTLDERRDDIPQFIELFLQRLASEQNIRARFTLEALELLKHARWPGQVRELEGVVETSVKLELSGTASTAIVDGPTAQFSIALVQEHSRRLEEERAGKVKREAKPAEVVVTAETVEGQLQARMRAFRTVEKQVSPPPPAAVPTETPRGADGSGAPQPRKRPDDLTAEDLRAALAATEGGNNKTQAARALGIAWNTLKKKMKAFEL